MNTPLDLAHAAVAALVRTFQQNEARYLAPQYQEAEARQDFIDKFWRALGWDVGHHTQTNPAEQEVKIERGVTVATAQKRADYAFFLAPNFRDVRFFVEAKKPSVNLNQNADAYFQTTRYGWNANTPLAVLTDFEQFHILDCRAKPDIRTATQRAHKKYQYTDFLDLEKFAEVYWLFSREALATGAFDRYVTTLPKPKDAAKQYKLSVKGFQPVDESFLDELEQHRETLAKAFKRDNPALDGYTLTEVTQRVLDRLVFLRFLEDKLIENEISVGKIGNSAAPWREFVGESKRLNARYNGAVYKPHPLIDSNKFSLDGGDFGEICRALSSDYSPYDFNAIPIHILGSIYERFLGKVIVATDKRARLEEKPEVRKAGGVYYTPEYIVRYIVDQTVGQQIEGKTPTEIAKLRFADIACGSGSFLLSVFDSLLRYHTRWYNTHPDKAERAGCVPTGDGAWRLTLGQRREILLNNVYGVDIDAQAVDVTQVSLYLKLLEDETTASSNQFELQFHETLLPSLGGNIVCGNSLIGSDILSGQLFASDEERALNPMDFEAAFPQVMRAGGFDAIVGNPPYIRIQTLNETNPHAVAHFGQTYKAASKGNYDIYVVFVERALQLLNKEGVLGYILPHKFFNAKYGAGLRNVIAAGKHLAKIVHFGDQQVFAGATTYTCLLFLSKKRQSEFEFEKVKDLAGWAAGPALGSVTPAEHGMLDAGKATVAEWNFNVGISTVLLDNLSQMPVKLGDFADVFVGLQTSADDVFILDLIKEGPNSLVLQSKSLASTWTFEKDLFQPVVSGIDVNRYAQLPTRQFILFPYEVVDEQAILLEFELVESKYPKTARYLLANQKRLENREGGKFRDKKWYRFGRSQNLGIQNRIKLCTPRLVNFLYSAFDRDGRFFLDNVDVGGITLKNSYGSHSYLYLLGLLNSFVLRFYFPSVSAPFRGGFMSANKQFLSQLPIRPINFADPADKAQHDKMVSLVEQMLEAKQKLAAAQNEGDTNYYTRRCAQLDQQIDALVYALYGLTDAEIAIVEGRV